RTEDGGGGGEGVGERGAGGDDRDAAVAADRLAGARVDDVGVAAAVDDQVLTRVAGGGNAAVGNFDIARRRFVGIERGDADAPAACAGRWIGGGDVAASSD